MLGGCCGPCYSGNAVLLPRATFATVQWWGVRMDGELDHTYTPTDLTTAYLTQTVVTTLPDLTGIFGAGSGWGQQVETVVTTINKWTGAVTTGSPSYSGGEAAWIARNNLFGGMVGTAPGPFVYSSDTVGEASTLYYTGTAWITAWSQTVTLSSPRSIADANADCATLLAAATQPTALAWGEINQASYNAAGAIVNAVENVGTWETYVDAWNYYPIAVNLLIGDYATSGPPDPFFGPPATQGIGQMRANYSFWTWSVDGETGAYSGCNYVCHPCAAGPIYGSTSDTTYGLPAAGTSTSLQGDFAPVYSSTGIDTPCGSASYPSCSGWHGN